MVELPDSTYHITHKALKGWAGPEVANALRLLRLPNGTDSFCDVFQWRIMDPQIVVDHGARKDATQ